MKLEPATKLDKRNETSTKIDDNVMSGTFSQFMVNLEQSGSRILKGSSVIPTFSLKAAFYRTKMRTKLNNF